MTSGHFNINQKARLKRAKSDTSLLRLIPELPNQDQKTDSILATNSFRTVVTSTQKPRSLLNNGTSVTKDVSEITTNTVSIDHKVAVSSQAGQFTAEYLIKKLVEDAKYSDEERSLAIETMKHVLKESTEVLYWALQEKKDETSTVIHYKNTLFQSMRHVAQKSPRYDSRLGPDLVRRNMSLCFKPQRIIHVHNVEQLKLEETKKGDSQLLNLHPYIDKKTKRVSLLNAIVYIPICTGSEEALKGEALQEAINAYLSLGARQIYVYLGRYTGDDNPGSSIAIEGENQRKNWIDKNQRYIPNKCNVLNEPIVKVVTRQEMVKQSDYLLCESIAEEMFLKDEDVSRSILDEAKKYVQRKRKQGQISTKVQHNSTSPMLGASTVEAKTQQSESRSSYAPVPRRAPSPLLSMNLTSSQPASVSGSPQSPSRVTTFTQGSIIPSTPLLKADVKPRSRSAPASLSSSPDSHPAMGSVDSVTALLISELARNLVASRNPDASDRVMEMLEKLRKLSPVQSISESEGLVKNPSALISCPTVSTHSRTLFSSRQQTLMNGVTLQSTQPSSVTASPVTAILGSKLTPSK